MGEGEREGCGEGGQQGKAGENCLRSAAFLARVWLAGMGIPLIVSSYDIWVECKHN